MIRSLTCFNRMPQLPIPRTTCRENSISSTTNSGQPSILGLTLPLEVTLLARQGITKSKKILSRVSM